MFAPAVTAAVRVTTRVAPVALLLPWAAAGAGGGCGTWTPLPPAPRAGFAARRRQAPRNTPPSAATLRVIDVDGSQLGVLAADAAAALAAERGLDLLSVAPAAQPPVVRLGSSTAQRLAKEKKAAATRRAARAARPKEVRLTARVAPHDLAVKLKQLTKFLAAGRPVRLSVAFQPGSSYSAQEGPRKALVAAAVAEVDMGGWADPNTLRTSVRAAPLAARKTLRYAAPLPRAPPQGTVMQVDFRPTGKASPEEQFAILGALGTLPTGEGQEPSASMQAYLAGKASRDRPAARASKRTPGGGRRGAAARAVAAAQEEMLETMDSPLSVS